MKSKAVSTVTKSLPDFFDILYKSLVFSRYSFFLKTLKYKNGTSKEFYRIGISTNTTGISIYIFGVEDKNFLKNTFGSRLGQAKITGYCIKFKNLASIDFDVLKEMILFGLNL